ncbi:nuclear transport factor 2 family protein [Croceitalea marina]|uniref:Nuclear transport factor 2 family protein n=1 Tax=Croceitalea marina TaxID=1775166 RepID=A0ABW5MTH1_9FLAO
MKNNNLVLIVFALMFITGCVAQDDDNSRIKAVITQFSKAGDNNDAVMLETCLDDNYRIVMNRLFGSSDVSVMDKAVYLDKIHLKEFGGDSRILTIEKIVLNETTASAKVVLKGTKSTFTSLFALVKDTQGNWKIIGEMPIMQQI